MVGRPYETVGAYREMWEDVRAVMLRIGDTTPVGIVSATEYFGTPVERVILTIGGKEYDRPYGAIVSRRVA